ncbi:MAG TPA: hypothetical protein VGD17_06820 [Chitinophagaceae bacterium]
MRTIIISMYVAVMVLVVACSKSSGTDNPPPPPPPPGPDTTCNNVDSRFSARVLPIIQSSCATSTGCHATGSINGPGALTSFAQISNASSAIRSAVISGRMPPGGNLSAADKNAIICWVNSGAPNN